MEGQRINTTSGPETSTRRRLRQHNPNLRLRPRKQDKTIDASREETRQGHLHQQPHITMNTLAKTGKANTRVDISDLQLPYAVLKLFTYIQTDHTEKAPMNTTISSWRTTAQLIQTE